jgi:hypothetical protein
MILFYFAVGSTSSGSAFVIAPKLGAKTILSWFHFEDDSSPNISWFGSSIRIIHTFVLFKNVTLTWIKYLETWLRSDNTSCYYRIGNKKMGKNSWCNFCLVSATTLHIITLSIMTLSIIRTQHNIKKSQLAMNIAE